VVKVECPECGEQFETDAEVLFLLNRFYCSLCDALLEVVEEDPLVLEVVDEGYSEGDEEDDDWEAE
jgi:peptide subunit release factor 1 (eRF1)